MYIGDCINSFIFLIPDLISRGSIPNDFPLVSVIEIGDCSSKRSFSCDTEYVILSVTETSIVILLSGDLRLNVFAGNDGVKQKMINKKYIFFMGGVLNFELFVQRGYYKLFLAG